MRSSLKKVLASIASVTTLFISTVGMNASAVECPHYGTYSTFKTTCGNTKPYYVTVRITNTSNTIRYLQGSIYAGSSLGSLSPQRTVGAATASNGYQQCDKSNLSQDYVRCNGYCYGDSSPSSAIVDSYVCDVIVGGNIAIP